MTDPRETLARIRERADAATPGPWETDGTGEVSQHWSRPKPWETVVGTEVSCMSYCYGGSAKGVERAEDAKFIAAARADVPWLLEQVELRDKALDAVMELHRPVLPYMLDVPEVCEHCSENEDEREVAYPCPTVTAITTALEGEKP